MLTALLDFPAANFGDVQKKKNSESANKNANGMSEKKSENVNEQWAVFALRYYCFQRW